MTTVVLDKTGTLTEAKPTVTDVRMTERATVDEASMLRLVIGLESNSEHPLAAAVLSYAKERNLARLRRIEGQVRGIHKMVEEDRYCADVLVQISAVHETLRGVGREFMRSHLRHFATATMRGTRSQAAEMHDEILELMYRHVR